MSTLPDGKTFSKLNAVREFILSDLQETGAASLAVGVAMHGDIVYEEAFGLAQKEARIPATVDTRYTLASVSKPITATGIMALHERGLLDIDAPIQRYLGDARLSVYRGNSDDVTARRVMSHSAGLPMGGQYSDKMPPDAIPSPDDTIRRYGFVVSAPGSAYCYSNVGYGMLGRIIENVSGESLEHFMRENVFEPLGMTSSTFFKDDRVAAITAHRYNPRGDYVPDRRFANAGACAAYSTVRDLLNFGYAQINPDASGPLSRETFSEMFRPVIGIEKGVSTGLGWRIVANDNGYLRVGHSGSMIGICSDIVMVPSEGFVAAIVANDQSDLHRRLINKLLWAFLPDYSEQTGYVLPVLRQRVSPQAFVPTAQFSGLWTGHVRTHCGTRPLVLEIHPNGPISVRLADGAAVPLERTSYANHELRGTFSGDIGTDDAAVDDYYLELKLRLSGNELAGVTVAHSTPTGLHMPEELPYWTQLTERRPNRD